MDRTTLSLFGRFPREVANPNRWLVNSIPEMRRFIDYNNGITDIYVSLYSSNYVIDKIYFDFDYGPSVLDDTKKVYKWLMDKDYSVIPVVSGKKGYHLYAITKPKIYGVQAKLLLTKATYSIIKSVFGSFRQEVHIKPDGKQVRVLRNSERIIGPDPTCIGDVRRITRVPNTLRPPENLNYCTYLPPDDFLKMTEADVIDHMKEKHSYTYKIDYSFAPLLTDFEFDLDKKIEAKQWESIGCSSTIATSNPNLFLEQIIRPCLYRHIISIHPSHDVRVATTIDLLNFGYSPEEILDLYSTLGWEDFEEGLCLSQIKSCKKYEPYSCSKLRKYGIPEVCCVG